MKQFAAFVLAVALVAPLSAQVDSTAVQPEPPAQPEVPQIPEVPQPDSTANDDIVYETPDRTKISVGENEIFIIEESGDTTRLQLGSKGMSIVEGEEGYTIDIIEMEDDKDDEASSWDEELEDDIEKEIKRSRKKFKPHFGGFEIGLNNFAEDYKLHTGSFMNLNTTESWNYNLNFMEYGFGLGTSYVGLVTGLGFEWSNYVFDNNNSIEEAADGSIIERVAPYPSITKSKLATTYLNAPLLLEFQIPAGKKRIHISGGVIGGVKLGSKTKIKYRDSGRQKEVRKDDFSLSPLRYGATVRVGYRAINLFANYYFTPMFGETADPEIYPFSVGLTIIPF